MIEILEIKIEPNNMRIGVVSVKYYNLLMLCEICVYKDSHLWVKMPQWWVTTTHRIRFAFWETDEQFSEFQALILAKALEVHGLNFEMGLSIKKKYFEARKQLTKQKNKITLNGKNLKE